MTNKPVRLAVVLIGATLLYNLFEGAASIYLGIKASSLTLVTFGADSYLEVLAAGAVLWRLSCQDEEAGERAEERALRFVGVTFLLLGAAVVFQASFALVNKQGASESLLGIGLLAVSLTLMPAVSMAKLWQAAKLGMPVLVAEARETLACSYLSLTALLGLVAVAVAGWWWLDSFAALVMVPWLVKEGMEGLRAEACLEGVQPCFCRSCLFGIKKCVASCCAVPAA